MDQRVLAYSVRKGLRFSVVTVDLSSEGVEDVGGSSRIDKLHIAILMLSNELLRRRVLEGVIVAQLQESFDTSTRVLGTLSIVSVRKRHDETRSLKPFLLSRGDKLHSESSVKRRIDGRKY